VATHLFFILYAMRMEVKICQFFIQRVHGMGKRKKPRILRGFFYINFSLPFSKRQE
jgi:hypothetical protein